jgi:hypothetical protein
MRCERRIRAYRLIVLMGSVLLCGRAQAQDTPLPQELARNPETGLEAVLRYPLLAGGALVHDQYDGRLYRFDQTGKQVARTKVPKAAMLAKHTVLVLSRDQSHVLVVHHADTIRWPARSQTLLLDGRTLTRITEWPLGRCDDVRGWDALPAITDRLTLLCQESRPPDKPKDKTTLAVVALDLSAGKIVSWSPVGGERHGAWVGPMFFGYHYDASAVPVKINGKDCPTDSASGTIASGNGAGYPWRVIVLTRSNGEHKGEIWLIDGFGAPPRRVATLPKTPESASICGDERKVLVVREQVGDARSALGSVTETFDLGTTQRVR